MPVYPSVFELLADDASASLVIDLLRYRIDGNFFNDPADIADDQYLPFDLSGFPPGISFVDGGAFDGDTFRHLSKKGVNFRHWIAFEPDERTLRPLPELPDRRDASRPCFPAGSRTLNRCYDSPMTARLARRLIAKRAAI
jgi:hypothetical protein